MRPFTRLVPQGAVWAKGGLQAADAIIWCTGFRPVLGHLRPLLLPDEAGRVAVTATGRAAAGLWLLGYGDRTGHASATLAGITRAARETIAALVAEIKNSSDTPL